MLFGRLTNIFRSFTTECSKWVASSSSFSLKSALKRGNLKTPGMTSVIIARSALSLPSLTALTKASSKYSYAHHSHHVSLYRGTTYFLESVKFWMLGLVVHEYFSCIIRTLEVFCDLNALFNRRNQFFWLV